MIISQTKGTITLILAVLIVAFAIVTLSTDYNSEFRLSPDPIMAQKAKILALASSESALSFEAREIIFRSLSGKKVLQYQFTPEEKLKIIKVLNK